MKCSKCNGDLLYIKGKYNKYEFKCINCNLKWIYVKHTKGEQVYPNWRVDKNISWWNIKLFFGGLFYSLRTFEMLKDPETYLDRFNIKFWMPPVYDNNYYYWKIK